MRWLASLFAALLLLTSLSPVRASRSSLERFQDLHTKSLSSSPVKLDDATFKSVTSAPRDYTVMVLLTALDSRFGCKLCSEFQPEWDILAESWTKGDKKGESRVIFATLDFTEGRETFMSVCEHPNSIPRSRTHTLRYLSSVCKLPPSSYSINLRPAITPWLL